MPRFPVLLLVWFGALTCAAAQEVSVALVRFNAVQAPHGASGNWLEVDVDLQVRPSGSRGQMVSRVLVGVLLGFELPAPPAGERRTDYYRAEAECVALEPGRAHVRFYLPPELVKRDQLLGGPRYWAVELTVAGRAISLGAAGYAQALPTSEQRRHFQARGAAEAGAHDGLLQPQYLTPFAHHYPRATPSFVRKGRRRKKEKGALGWEKAPLPNLLPIPFDRRLHGAVAPRSLVPLGRAFLLPHPRACEIAFSAASPPCDRRAS